jgi:PhnB protein
LWSIPISVKHEQKKGTVMNASYKPQGYSSVSPYLIVSGAQETIDFLIRVFDAVELQRFPDPHGKLMHAEVRIADTVVMLADGGGDWPPIAANVHVYVADVDATYQRALEAGATSVQVPVKQDDADKRGGVRDGGGTTWWIATRVA